MTNEELSDLEYRARLFTAYGDKDALRNEDVELMISDLRESRRLVAHLIAINRDALISGGPGKPEPWS